MRECFLDRIFGNFVEDHALRLLKTDRFFYVPCNSLALTVGVGRKEDLLRRSRCLLDAFDDFALVWRNHILRNEPVLDIDGVLIGLREVAHVAHRGKHLVVFSEVLLDSARLCRRLDDEETFSHVIQQIPRIPIYGQAWRLCEGSLDARNTAVYLLYAAFKHKGCERLFCFSIREI